MDALLKAGHIWVVDADIKSYFDTIPHDALMGCVEKKIADGRVVELVHQYLKQGILEGMREWEPEEGTPQGAVISPLLANIYLDPLDHQMADAGYKMVRYADDFVVLCRSEEEARASIRKRPGSWTPPSPVALTSWGITSSAGTAGPGRRASRKSKTPCAKRPNATTATVLIGSSWA